MAGKTSEWRPGSTVCRCCLTEGCYKDISTEYFWMGKREVYAEMLSDTLNVSISYAQTGGRLICEPCIARLRDASDFKRQVQDCEKTFMNHLDPSTSKSSVHVEVESLEDVKMERVKVEKDASDDDDDYLPGPDFGDDDDDDDLDDEPLTKLASAKVKVPKKEAVEILDMLDTSQITVKRKASSKTKEPPKKVKKKEIVVKPTTSKAKQAAAEREKKKKVQKLQKGVVRRNALMVMEYATAYPFRLPDSTMMCVYCSESFTDPAEFRKHQVSEHPDYKVSLAFSHIKSVQDGLIKVDCTEMACRLCDEPLESVIDVANHLVHVHGKKMDLNADFAMIPFKIYKDKLQCTFCDAKFRQIQLLSTHLNTHFAKHMCSTCGKSYSTLGSLNAHLRTKCNRDSDKPFCRRCRKTFNNTVERMDHFLTSNRCCQYVCHFCSERYPTSTLKEAHMQSEHAMPAKTFPCPECDEVFNTKVRARDHFTVAHTNKFFKCQYCDKCFGLESKYVKHLVIHTGEKNYVCSYCSKAFGRKSSLSQHMWIHSEVKKHTCELCDKAFNQKVCWKAHMRSRHPELVDF